MVRRSRARSSWGECRTLRPLLGCGSLELRGADTVHPKFPGSWYHFGVLTDIVGIPAHPLFVHGAVVLVPLAALLLVVCAWSRRACVRAGWVLPLLTLAAVIGCYLAKESGERLEKLPAMASLRSQIEDHSTQGTVTFLWSVALFVLAVLVWAGSSSWVGRKVPVMAVLRRGAGAITLGVLSVLVAVGGIVGVVLAGHSGATMVWSGT